MTFYFFSLIRTTHHPLPSTPPNSSMRAVLVRGTLSWRPSISCESASPTDWPRFPFALNSGHCHFRRPSLLRPPWPHFRLHHCPRSLCHHLHRLHFHFRKHYSRAATTFAMSRPSLAYPPSWTDSTQHRCNNATRIASRRDSSATAPGSS